MNANSLFILILFFSLACGDSSKKETSNSANQQEITNWARPGAESQMSGAYFTYTNSLDVADTIISVQSSSAMMTQVHESYTTDDGLAGMREMKQIIVQPRETLVLQRGGLHIMLMNLKKDLVNGDSISVKLTFSQAGLKELKLPVLSSN